tara:strand:+ start:3293 stop:3778 length:486 start_codon:yes stop_codon:yes gene_type:complete
MSLKAFHLVFVIASILLGLGVAGWGLMEFESTGDIGALILGIVFLITGVGLFFYGKRMLKKTEHIGYLSLIFILGLEHQVQACATCYGESDSPMAEGMNAGIFVLLIIVGATLSGFIAFFVFLARRARHFELREKLLKNPALLGVNQMDLSQPPQKKEQAF